MSERSSPEIKLCSNTEDTPTDGLGVLIPRSVVRDSKTLNNQPKKHGHTYVPTTVQKQSAQQRRIRRVQVVGKIAGATVAVFLLLAVFGVGYGMVTNAGQLATSVLTVGSTKDGNKTIVEIGPNALLNEATVFEEVREAFIEARKTFVEVDITNKQLRYFKRGVLFQSAEVLAVSEEGSWRSVPSGLYELNRKQDIAFSNIEQVRLPWQLSFSGNYVIHGWPKYSDNTVVLDEFVGGGIRLSDADAEELYKEVRLGVPILVHQKTIKKADAFVFEPRVPEMQASHYYASDLESGTLLASSDLNKQAPIASLTKLMTAVVAAEQMDLDGRVSITSPTFVTSIIPRLKQGSSVSVYSLLQLLLVESSNEASETIAGEVGREKFITAMNDKARQLGMLHTNFADPSGLSSQNVSTVGDLSKLVSHIYQNHHFIFDITARTEVKNAYVGGEFSDLVNFNEVKDLDGFVGGKIGETLAAKQTSITLHKVRFGNESRTIVVILLGTESRSEEVIKLLSYVRAKYSH
jgi:hypothetical protein